MNASSWRQIWMYGGKGRKKHTWKEKEKNGWKKKMNFHIECKWRDLRIFFSFKLMQHLIDVKCDSYQWEISLGVWCLQDMWKIGTYSNIGKPHTLSTHTDFKWVKNLMIFHISQRRNKRDFDMYIFINIFVLSARLTLNIANDFITNRENRLIYFYRYDIHQNSNDSIKIPYTTIPY